MSAAQPTPIYLLATLSDATGLDFEAPIIGSVSARHSDMSTVYEQAAMRLAGPEKDWSSPSAKVFSFLAAVLGMHPTPRDRASPFRPMCTYSNIARTAAAEDFRRHGDLLEELAGRATNPVLRARLADVGWLTNKRRHELAPVAVAAYLDVAEGIERGSLKTTAHIRLDSAFSDGLEHEVAQLLRRAMHILLETGWKQPGADRFRAVVTRLRLRAKERGAANPMAWFSELALDGSVSLSANVAEDIEAILRTESGFNSDTKAGLWEMAARAYGEAKAEDDRNRCLYSASQAEADEAQRLVGSGGSAMLASKQMQKAIIRLHGLPKSRTKKQEYQKLLVEMQSRIPDEASMFTEPAGLVWTESGGI